MVKYAMATTSNCSDPTIIWKGTHCGALFRLVRTRPTFFILERQTSDASGEMKWDEIAMSTTFLLTIIDELYEKSTTVVKKCLCCEVEFDDAFNHSICQDCYVDVENKKARKLIRRKP